MVLALSDRIVAKGVEAGPLLGDIIKLVDGRGGGKKNLAQAGGKAPERLGDAIAYGRKRLEESLLAAASA
jgi:alanyl-tRNA synthetase